MSQNRRDFLIGFSLFLILFLIKLQTFNTSLFWDESVWFRGAEWISENGFYPIPPGSFDMGGLDTGHPPFTLVILSMAFIIFGKSIFIAHFIMFLFSFLMLYFTYKLGSHIFNETTGIIASLLLLASPLFIAQSSLVNLDIPLGALALITIYSAIKEKKLAYLISGSLLVLSKEPGILTILSISLYIFLINYKKEPKSKLLKKCFIYMLPLAVFIAWSLFHYSQQPTGTLSGIPEHWKSFSLVFFLRLVSRIKYLFFDNYHWLLTLAFFISTVPSNKYSSLTMRKFLFFTLITIGLYALLSLFLGFIINYPEQISNFLSSNARSFVISARSVEDILLSIYPVLFGIVIVSIFILIFRKSISFNLLKKEKLYILIINIILYLVLFSWTVNAPRYFIPVLPLFFIINGYFLYKISNMSNIRLAIIMMIITILFITQWHSDDTETKGWIIERNLDYVDVVKTHKEAVNYIEKELSHATALTLPILADELRYPSLGYTKNPINPLEYKYFDENYKNTFFLHRGDWYYYSCYSKKECDSKKSLPVGTGDIRTYDPRYNENLDESDFDIFYYSPQAPLSTKSLKLIEDFSLVLIKRYESNGKHAEIYATNNFLKKQAN